MGSLNGGLSLDLKFRLPFGDVATPGNTSHPDCVVIRLVSLSLPRIQVDMRGIPPTVLMSIFHSEVARAATALVGKDETHNPATILYPRSSGLV